MMTIEEYNAKCSEIKEKVNTAWINRDTKNFERYIYELIDFEEANKSVVKESIEANSK